MAVTLKLRQQILGPLDRACHQLREETDKRTELNNIPGDRHVFPININRIAKRLESIETDADGQNHVQRYPVQLIMEHMPEQLRQTVREKVVILEYT